MLKYVHIILFLLSNDLTELKKYWEVEFIKKNFTWWRLLRKLMKTENKFIFWWRLSSFMFHNGNGYQEKTSHRIHAKISIKYTVDIGIRALIGLGLNIPHCSSIIINGNVRIGENFTCLQNVTIGNNKKQIDINIGNNVVIGANSVILGGVIKIGDNVNIGAMSFINKNIPEHCTVYTKKINEIVVKNSPL